MAYIKDLSFRLNELSVALRALNNSCANFNKTRDEAYLLDVMGRLRALVAMGGQNMKPLLIEIADEQGIPLEFYSHTPKPTKAPDNLAAHIYAYKTWSINQQSNMQKYSLKEWLDAPAYFVDQTRDFRSRNQVIKHLSNTEGGSHYDTKTAAIVDNLKRTTGSNYGGVQFFLMDVSCLISWLGERLLLTIENRQSGLAIEDDIRISRLDEGFDNVRISMI
jgi:hypothetical protein